jgi:hypothetical protein
MVGVFSVFSVFSVFNSFFPLLLLDLFYRLINDPDLINDRVAQPLLSLRLDLGVGALTGGRSFSRGSEL